MFRRFVRPTNVVVTTGLRSMSSSVKTTPPLQQGIYGQTAFSEQVLSHPIPTASSVHRSTISSLQSMVPSSSSIPGVPHTVGDFSLPSLAAPSLTSLTPSFRPHGTPFQGLNPRSARSLGEHVDEVDIGHLAAETYRFEVEALGDLPESTRDEALNSLSNLVYTRGKKVGSSKRDQAATYQQLWQRAYEELADRDIFSLGAVLEFLENGNPRGADVQMFDTSQSSLSQNDVTVFCTVQNEAMLRVVSDMLLRQLQLTHPQVAAGFCTLVVEGTETDPWLLLDFGSVAIHLSYGISRQFHNTEACIASKRIAREQWLSYCDHEFTRCVVIARARSRDQVGTDLFRMGPRDRARTLRFAGPSETAKSLTQGSTSSALAAVHQAVVTPSSSSASSSASSSSASANDVKS